MKFTPIDMSVWPEGDNFRFFINNFCCRYSITVSIDISKLYEELEKRKIGVYCALIYCITNIINNHEEFRISYDKDGSLGVWDELNPSHTVFNQDVERFGVIWTEYNKDFKVFNTSFLQDINEYKMVPSPAPKPNRPHNTFMIYTLPYIDFTGYNINSHDDKYFLPFFALGKISHEGNKTSVPMAIQVHSAICDSFRVGRIISEVRKMCENFEDWLK